MKRALSNIETWTFALIVGGMLVNLGLIGNVLVAIVPYSGTGGPHIEAKDVAGRVETFKFYYALINALGFFLTVLFLHLGLRLFHLNKNTKHILLRIRAVMQLVLMAFTIAVYVASASLLLYSLQLEAGNLVDHDPEIKTYPVPTYLLTADALASFAKSSKEFFNVNSHYAWSFLAFSLYFCGAIGLLMAFVVWKNWPTRSNAPATITTNAP